MYTMPNTDMTHEYSGVARNLIWGWVYVLTSHCNFKTCVNIPHVNKTVTDFFLGGGLYISIYPPSLRPWTSSLH